MCKIVSNLIAGFHGFVVAKQEEGLELSSSANKPTLFLLVALNDILGLLLEITFVSSQKPIPEFNEDT